MANTENYPVRWSTVHFGLHADALTEDPYTSFRDAVLARGWLMFVDGDGWQVWGEKPGIDNNDTDTKHVQIAVPTKADAAAAVNMLRDSRLPFVPMVNTDHAGTVSVSTIVVSSSEDWAEEQYAEDFAA